MDKYVLHGETSLTLGLSMASNRPNRSNQQKQEENGRREEPKEKGEWGIRADLEE